ncbi:hypothetical protein Cgig2_021954 [Carnegiea gigantea]|uniref:Uncharacterized protein n=1 Tax=Carnegiea gigantea TaxID=171969 RepID=A0A9Q1KT33_9CARY|nr:hypothetical protein Cgig2_021954 [Carnegiea gigantea]
MGLDSMPENNTYTPNESVFFKSKSLNSLNFFPDFNTNKASYSALQRRSASFSHLGSSFSFKIEEEVNSSKLQSHENRGGEKQRVKKQGKGEKVVAANLKGNEGRKNRVNKKYEETYATKTRRSVKNNNVGCGRGRNLIRDQKCALLVKKQGKLRGERGVNDVGLNVSGKKRVHHDHDKEEDLNNHVDNEVLIDSLSRSPVSVLDHHLLHLELDYSPSKEDARGTTSSTRRKKPTTKTKSKTEGRKSDSNHQKLKKEGDQEPEMAEYFVGLLGQICRLTEEHVKDPKWVAKSRGFKVQFVEELSLDFGGQILDLLLNELIDELLII